MKAFAKLINHVYEQVLPSTRFLSSTSALYLFPPSPVFPLSSLFPRVIFLNLALAFSASSLVG